jgi:putative DeoR family transcriptional regulator (stage III sporulation protein D)
MDSVTILAMGKHFVSAKDTVRGTAKKFGVSKSTVHKLLTTELFTINPALASDVREILNLNKLERHLRGGIATKKLYEKRRLLK